MASLSSAIAVANAQIANDVVSVNVTDRLINELASGWASNPTDIRLPRAYAARANYSSGGDSGGFMGKMGRYAKNLGAALGAVYVLAGAPGCGDSPTSPTPPTPTPTPTTFSITKPAANEKVGTPFDVSYMFNSAGASHADFILDGGAVQHDATLDGAYQIPEEGVLGGNHTLAGYLVDASENKLAGTDASVNFHVISVTGDITDRIAGGNVSGSTITWSGPVTKSARVNSPYTIHGLPPGNYEVTISGGGHVQHKNLSVPVSASESFPFSVLKWGSGRQDIPGVVYDQTFHGFFNLFARPVYVIKWVLESVKPTEIYVTLDGLSQPAAEEVKTILNEVDNESIPDMYCGEVGPLPINYGTPIARYKTGTIVIDFRNNAGRTSYNADVPRDFVITSAHIEYDIDTLDDSIGGITTRQKKKNHIAHELMHTNGSSHAFNTYRDSLEGGWDDITRPSKEDDLASCIMLNRDTHPGNQSPDTNPTYTVGANGSFTLRR